jgi:hypothetical protein
MRFRTHPDGFADIDAGRLADRRRVPLGTFCAIGQLLPGVLALGEAFVNKRTRSQKQAYCINRRNDPDDAGLHEIPRQVQGGGYRGHYSDQGSNHPYRATQILSFLCHLQSPNRSQLPRAVHGHIH